MATQAGETQPERGRPLGFPPVRRRTVVLVLVFLAPVLGGAANLLVTSDAALRGNISDLLQIVEAMLAGVAFALATHKLRAARSDAAAGWTLFSIGASLLIAGQLAVVAEETIRGSVGFPNVSDPFSLTAYAVLTAAVLRLPRDRLDPRERRDATLDLGVLTIITFVGWWELSLGRLVGQYLQRWDTATLVGLAYAILNLGLLAALFRQLVFSLPRGRMFVPNLLLVLSGLCLASADLAMSGLGMGGGFQSGSVIDVGWLVCAAAAGLAGLYVIERGDDADLTRNAPVRAIWAIAFDYVCLGTGVTILMWDLLRNPGANQPLAVGGAVLVLVLVAYRQIDAVRRNTQLAERLELARDTLEQEVVTRTADLAAATASLRASEEELRATFEGAPLGIAIMDAQTGRVVEANDKCGEIFRLSHEQVLALDWIALTPPEAVAEHDALLRRLLAGELAQIAMEKLHRLPDGSSLWTRMVIAPLRGGEPGLQRLLVIIEDTTSRRAAADALASAHELLERTGALAHVGGWEFDLRANALHWSSEVYRLTDVPADFTPTMATALDWYAPEAQPVIAAAVDRAVADGTPFDLVLPAVTATGRRMWVHTQGSAKFADGAAVLVYGAVQDITREREAEEALRRKSEELDRYFSASLDLLCIASTDGRFLRLNPEWGRVLGYATDELIGQRFLDFVHHDDVDSTLGALGRLQHAEAVLSFTNRYRAKDGTYHWIEWRAAPVDDLIYAVARDITDRKAAEEANALLEAQVRQAQKMESVGRLAGGVAHDFNNMLGAILGNAELALGALDGNHPVRADIVEIQRAARRSADLTRQLLAFARKTPVSPKLLDLNGTVPGLLPMIQRLIGTGIRLTWEPGADLWPVAIDPAQVDQALVNLCINGRDAIGDVGAITISTENRSVDAAFCASHPDATPGDYVVLLVRDTGAGMPASVIEHLFEPFYTTKTVGAGTGLGLATVYGSVRQASGFITVASEPGSGSTFEIHLPRQTGSVEQLRGPEGDAPAEHERATILLVEDEPALLRLTTRLLDTLGYAVIGAGDPAEAMRLHREHAGAIDLLLTDVVMPGTNGRDLAAQLKAAQPGLRCVFMSGHAADIIALDGREEPDTLFIQKPFSVAELGELLRIALADRPAPAAQAVPRR